MAYRDTVEAGPGPAPRGAARVPGWYLIAWTIAMLAILVWAPLVRLTHAGWVGSVLVVVFLAMIGGSRMGLSLTRGRGYGRPPGRGPLSPWVLWLLPIVATTGGFVASLALTRNGYPGLAVVLSVLIVAVTSAVMVHQNAPRRAGQ